MSGNFNTSTAMQEPWGPQQEPLKQAFRGAEDIYN